MLGTYHLNALFEILNKVHFVYQPIELWEFVLQQACNTLKAEAGTYYELIENEKELRIAAAVGVDLARLKQVPFRVGSGISGWVAQYHQPALVNDVRTDNRFNTAIDQVTGFTTKSILCIPIFSIKRTYGVLEILNRHAGPFGAQDQEFLTLLGRQAAVAYQNLLLIAEVSQTKVLMESLLQSLSGGLIAMDSREMITVLNSAAARLLNLPDSGSVEKKAQDVLSGTPWFLEILQKTLTSRQTVSRQEAVVLIEAQEVRVGYTTILVVDQQKNVLGAGVIFQKLEPRG